MVKRELVCHLSFVVKTMKHSQARAFCFLATWLFLFQIVAPDLIVPPWGLRVSQEQGPNVCLVEDAVGGRTLRAQCRLWVPRKVCGEPTLMRFECCEGYEQIEGTKGCLEVKPVSDILSTARAAGAGRFIDQLERAGITVAMQSQGSSYTILAPSDEAIEREGGEISREILGRHVIHGRIPVSGFPTQAQTVFNGPSVQLQNTPGGIATADCVPIIRRDINALDGMVHILDGVIAPVTSGSLFSELTRQPQLGTSARFFHRAPKFQSRLERVGTCSLLVPNDEAWSSLHEEHVQRLMQDDEAMMATLEAHTLPGLVCPDAILANQKLPTLDGKRIHAECDQHPGANISGVRIKRKDAVWGQQGIAYPIEKTLLPERARPIADIIKNKAPEFTRILKQAGYSQGLPGDGRITLFIPKDSLIEDYKPKDKTDARNFISRHSANGKILSKDIIDGQQLNMLDGSTARAQILWHGGISISGAIINEPDTEALDCVAHSIDAILPENTAYTVAMQHGNLSVVGRAIRLVGPSVLPKGATLLAPTDLAFREALGEAGLRRLQTNLTALGDIIKRHIIPRPALSHSLQEGLTYRVPASQQGHEWRLQRVGENLQIETIHLIPTTKPVKKIRPIRTSRCDLRANDATIHIVKQIIPEYYNYKH